MLICEYCGEEFVKSVYTRSVQRYCKSACQASAYYRKNKEKLCRAHKERRLRDKLQYGEGFRRSYPRAIRIHAWYKEIKSQPCTDCGLCFDPCCMDFDHVRGEKTHPISHMLRQEYSMERIEEEIAKCELVCANCHRIRTRDRQLGKGCFGKKFIEL